METSELTLFSASAVVFGAPPQAVSKDAATITEISCFFMCVWKRLISIKITKGSIPEHMTRNISFYKFSFTALFTFHCIFLTITVRSFSYIFIKCSIKRLTIGKTYHRADFLNILVSISLICQ